MSPSLMPALVAGAAALIGAWLGAVLALQRFKRERAFDRRLQWYHDAQDALADLDDAITKLRELVELHGWNATEQEKWAGEITPAIHRIGKLLDSGLMYATRTTLTTLQSAVQQTDAVGEPWVVGDELQENAAFFDTMQERLNTARYALALDGRELLFPDWRPRWLRSPLPLPGGRS